MRAFYRLLMVSFALSAAGCSGDTAPVDAATDVSGEADVDVFTTSDAPSGDDQIDVPNGGQDVTDVMSGPCATQDAMGMGTCPGHFGFAWNGVACVPIDGCACVGTACSSLTTMLSDCQTAHLSCPGIDCRTRGCSSGMTCQMCNTSMDSTFTCLPNGTSC